MSGPPSAIGDATTSQGQDQVVSVDHVVPVMTAPDLAAVSAVDARTLMELWDGVDSLGTRRVAFLTGHGSQFGRLRTMYL